MPSTDPQSLLAAAKCFDCFGQGSQLELMKLALLAQIAKTQNPMTATDPKSLLAQANCFSCYASSPFMLSLMELALLNLIVQNLNPDCCIVFGHYGGNAPNYTPVSGNGAAFDIDNGRPWYFFEGTWN